MVAILKKARISCLTSSVAKRTADGPLPIDQRLSMSLKLVSSTHHLLPFFFFHNKDNIISKMCKSNRRWERIAGECVGDVLALFGQPQGHSEELKTKPHSTLNI